MVSRMKSNPELKEDAVSQLLYQAYKDFHGFVADYPNEHNHELIGIFKAQAKSICAHFARPVVSREEIIRIINRNDDGDPLTDEKAEAIATAIHHLLEGNKG